MSYRLVTCKKKLELCKLTPLSRLLHQVFLSGHRPHQQNRVSTVQPASTLARFRRLQEAQRLAYQLALTFALLG